MIETIDHPISDSELIAALDTEGYILDPVDTSIVSRLVGHPKPQINELGAFIQSNDNWGMGTEYRGRLARAKETVGIATSVELSTREQFEWIPGDVVELNEFLPMVREGEEVQIRDYRGREYYLVKQGDLFSVIGAYAKDKPLTDQAGDELNGRNVHLSKYETDLDRKMKQHGMETSYIRLAEIGTQLRPSQHGGEEYIEERNGRKGTVSASRLQMTYDNSAYGVLVSHLKLVPHDIKERGRLEAAQWRLRDSIQTIARVLKPHSLHDGTSYFNSTFEIGDYLLSNVVFTNSGQEIRFQLEDTANTTMVEYYMGPYNSSEKAYLYAGNQWIPPLMQNQELDGSRRLHTLQAAKVLDVVRYSLQDSKV